MDYLGPYLLGPNNTKWQGIYTGDNRTLLKHIPAESVDMILTSPPYDGLRTYNGKWSFDFEGVASEAYRVLKTGGVMVWVVNDATINGCETLTTARQSIYFVDVAGFNLHDTMIWEKGKGSTPNTSKNPNRYQPCFEYMLVLSKGTPTTAQMITEPSKNAGRRAKGNQRQRNGKNIDYSGQYIVGDKSPLGNVWHMHVGWMHTTRDKAAYAHPAMFPEMLAERHILTWTRPGDVVVDPFMGAGTTAKMCKLHGRKWWGCDVSQEYADIARKRIQDAPVPLFTVDAPEPAAQPKQLSMIDAA